MNDVMEVIKANYNQPQLIPAMLALKRFCPELTPPRNLCYESSSHTYLNFARAHMRADCPIRNDNKPIQEIRKELEEYMPQGNIPPSIRLKYVIPERLAGQLPPFEALMEKAFEENRVIVFGGDELVGRNTLKVEINLRKDSRASANHFYGPEKLALLFQAIGIDFVSVKPDTSVQINLCFQSSPAADLSAVPILLATFLRFRHDDLNTLCKRLQNYTDNIARRPCTEPCEKEDKHLYVRKRDSRA